MNESGEEKMMRVFIVVLSLVLVAPVFADSNDEVELQKKLLLETIQDEEEQSKKILSDLGMEGRTLKDSGKKLAQQKKGRLENDCLIVGIQKSVDELARFLGSANLGSPKDGGQLDSLKDEFEKVRAAFKGDCSDHAMRETVEKMWGEVEDASLNLVRLQHVKRDLEDDKSQYKELLKKPREQPAPRK